MADLKTFRVYIRGDDPDVDVVASSFKRVPPDALSEDRGSIIFSKSWEQIAQFELDKVIGVMELPKEEPEQDEE